MSNQTVVKVVSEKYFDAYLKLGWTVKSVKSVTLRGINKQHDEYTVEWSMDKGEPQHPTDDD